MTRTPVACGASKVRCDNAHHYIPDPYSIRDVYTKWNSPHHLIDHRYPLSEWYGKWNSTCKTTHKPSTKYTLHKVYQKWNSTDTYIHTYTYANLQEMKLNSAITTTLVERCPTVHLTQRTTTSH